MTLDMIFVVQYKYLNCAVDKAIYISHTPSSGYNTDCRIILINDAVCYSLVQAFANKPI